MSKKVAFASSGFGVFDDIEIVDIQGIQNIGVEKKINSIEV